MMNGFGIIDYKQPIGAQNDYRTSTYRGHLKLDDHMPIRPAGALTNVCGKFSRDAGVEQLSRSEHQAQFSWKPTDSYLVRNPTIKDVKFIKPFEECYLRNAPKPVQAISSVFKQDYQWKSKAYEEKPPALSMITAVETTKNLSIDRGDPGCGKLLDPSATTGNLSYIAYTKNQLNIATKDNITFWNWNKQKSNVFKTKESMCDLFKSNDCPKRRREYQNAVKPVPNSGLTTETKSNYVEHLNCLNFDTTHIKNTLVSCPEVPMKVVSENNIYGSGNRIQNYIH